MTLAGTPTQDPLHDAQACIVWHPESRAPSPELLRALTNKGMTLIDADDAHTAFAAADRVSKSARRTVLVLDTRVELPDVDRVILSLERFLPRVLCWGFEPGANPPLVPIVQTSSSRPTAAEPREPISSSSSNPAPLRLVGQEAVSQAESAQTPSKTPSRPLTASDVLDADELDALLAGEMGDRPQ
jgi:hypothetical protein